MWPLPSGHKMQSFRFSDKLIVKAATKLLDRTRKLTKNWFAANFIVSFVHLLYVTYHLFLLILNKIVLLFKSQKNYLPKHRRVVWHMQNRRELRGRKLNEWVLLTFSFILDVFFKQRRSFSYVAENRDSLIDDQIFFHLCSKTYSATFSKLSSNASAPQKPI